MYGGQWKVEDMEKWALRNLLPEGNVIEVTDNTLHQVLMQELPIFFLVHKDKDAAYMKLYHKGAEENS